MPVFARSRQQPGRLRARAVKRWVCGCRDRLDCLYAAFCAVPAGLRLSALAFGGALGQDFIHGLKLVAAAVVAQAVWGMARNLCPDRERASIAVGAVLMVVFLPTALGQMGAIIPGAICGLWFCKNLPLIEAGHLNVRLSKTIAVLALLSFFILLIALPFIATASSSQTVSLFEAFYRAGAVVFGGGHVVLPLLEASVVETGWFNAGSFLAGYGAAQAVPGPLFTFAAYLVP